MNNSINRLAPRILSSSLYAYWHQHFTLEIPTLYPELHYDTSKDACWISLWIQSISHQRSRTDSVAGVDVVVVAHCMSQRGVAQNALKELVDEAVQVLSTKTIPLRAYDKPGIPVTGYIKLFEPTIENLTRPETQANITGIPHVILSWEGWGQSVC